jgi:nicotinate-nucleotide adenylyltransferase
MAESFGVFGGTFDPPHLGHLILAAEALNQLQLTKILWVLTPQPPHKPERAITPLHHRLEMLKRTVGNTPGFEISTVEIDRPGPHYTLDTLDLLQFRHPLTRLVLLIGGDSLRTLPHWDRAEELVTAAYSFGVMRRPSDEINLKTVEETLPGLTAKLRFIETPQLEISSSSIRDRVASGGHYRFYLTAGVYEYIRQNILYK